MARLLLASISVLALASMSATARAAPAGVPDQFELGRNGLGNPCTATRNWSDAGATDPFAQAYAFTCRGAVSNRYIGLVRKVAPDDQATLDATLVCGEARAFEVAGLGQVSSRNCFDKVLGHSTIETRLVKGGYVYSASASPFAQGPAEEALRILTGAASAGQDRGRSITAVIDVSALAPPPAGTFESSSAVADAQASLDQGIRMLRQGLHLDASRTFNEALTRLPAGTAIATRIDLLLLAGLADSNLRFFDSAQEYFRQADSLLVANSSIPGADVLARKRQNYAALDLLNRRDFSQAAGALDLLSTSVVDPNQPLLNGAIVRSLNQRPATSDQTTGVVAVPDEALLSQTVIDAQANWARSVALLGQNRPAESANALAIAEASFKVLQNEPIRQQQLFWLGARIERQRARLLLRTGDRSGSLAALDKAIEYLKSAQAAGDSGPALAQTQLERAGVLARGGADRGQVLDQFDDALESLANADLSSNQLPPSTAIYLDELIKDAAANPSGVSAERFFKALQIAADPAIARQFVELQTLVSADPQLASKVQDKEDLDREIIRLRYEAQAGAGGDPAKLAEIEARRRKLEDESLALDNELFSNKAFVQVTDRPATVADVRKALVPGESYFKLTRVGSYLFGIYIDEGNTSIYRVARPAIEIDPLIKLIRESVDGGTNNKQPVYQVAAAFSLYRLLAGPVADRLPQAKSLVVDASGVLDALPLGILVTDERSMKSFVSTRARSAYDYTAVAFLARQVPIATALSPRSLIVSRSLAPSQAPYPFIGFAQHMPAEISAQAGGQIVSVGGGCETELGAIAQLTRELRPISASELTSATEALGVPGAPAVTDAAFTDTAIDSRSDLDQFQIVHFATHGVTEGKWGCTKAPPGLVTSIGGRGSDGLLSFDEVAKLKLDANLVVLSACDTSAGVTASGGRAAGTEEVGASLDGLVRAFLAANARAVLSTYWPISDAGPSVQLITDFYGAARDKPIGPALQAAQANLIAGKDTSHPIFWGAFFLVGDGQQSLLSGAARTAVAPVKSAPAGD